MLIVGAFRSNEINEEHPLSELIREFRKEHSCGTCLLLPPLRRTETEKLVADMLDARLGDMAALCQYLYLKTGGNPFSLRQLLALIHDDGLLYFSRQKGCWQWDLEAIQDLPHGEDVLEMILRKIHRLPEETRELIKLASCYGNRFDLKTLAAFWGKLAGSTASVLMPSIHEGLVTKLAGESDEYPGINPSERNIVYEFVHDRVQQAVYSLVDEDEKKKMHVMIGTYLMENIPAGGIEENIMPIMDHFNRGLELIQDPEKRIRLAKYNLMAGRKARASAAYDSALQYLKCASMLVPDDVWEQYYSLSFDLYLEFAQAQYLCGETEAAEKLFDIVLGKAKTVLERADVYGLKMILYAGIGKLTESVHTGIQALRNLGLEIPVHPTTLDFLRELFLYKWHMRKRKIEELYYLPEMEDPGQKKISELLARLCYVTMSSFPELYSFIIIKTGNFALRHGNSEATHVGYLGYGITSGIIFGNYRMGERYANVCIRLMEKYDRSSSKCIIYFVVGSLIFHWTRHAGYGLDYLNKAVTTGIEAGNLVIVGYAHCILLENQYIMGAPLEKLNDEICEKYEVIKKIKHHNLMVNAAIYDSVVSALTGRKTDSLADGVEKLGKTELLHLAQKDKSALATFYCCRMQMYFMMGDHRSALSMSEKVRPLVGAIIGFLVYAEYFFYDSLTITAAYKDLPKSEQRRYMKVLKGNMRKLKKWAQSCKENFEHKYLLICAQTVAV